MSKERARRRAELEREEAVRAAARAAAQERREREEARRRTVRAFTTDRVRRSSVRIGGGRPAGRLATRSRLQTAALVAAYVVANLLVWLVRPDWPARLGAGVVSVLTFPVLRLLLFGRR